MSEMSGYLKKADGTLIEIVDKAARQTVSTKANIVHTHSISDVTGLQTALDGKDTAITNESTARENADTALQTAITNESTARTNADTALQTAIDGKAASVHTHSTSDVTGLQSYVDGRITANIKRFDPNTTYAEVHSWYNSKSGEVACFVKDGVPYLFSEYKNGEYLFNHRDGSDINTASVGSDNIWTVSSVTVPTMFDIPTVDVTKSYVDTSVTAEATARAAADAALKSDIGDLDNLSTTAKGNLVEAINEAAASGGGGTGGTTNYNALSNRPQINGITLSGNKTSEDLLIAASNHTHSYNDLTNKPTIPAAVTDDHIAAVAATVVPSDDITANTDARHTHSNGTYLAGLSDSYINGLIDTKITPLENLSTQILGVL